MSVQYMKEQRCNLNVGVEGTMQLWDPILVVGFRRIGFSDIRIADGFGPLAQIECGREIGGR